MPVPPSRDEILAKYRDVIEAEDFEILAANELPTPSQLQSEGACLEKLGPLGDCVIWLKKKLHGPIVVIALFGSFMSGIEYIQKGVSVSYDSLRNIAAIATEHTDETADRYAIGFRDDSLQKIVDIDWNNIPPGTGIAPFAPSWGDYVG